MVMIDLCCRRELTFSRDDHVDAGEIELENKAAAAHGTDSPPPAEEHPDEKMDEIEGETIIHLKQAPLQEVTCGSVIAVLLTLVFLSCSILCCELVAMI